MRCIAVLVLTFIGLLGCGDDLFDDFPQKLRTATTPQNAATVRYQGPTQTGFTVRASWRVETKLSWDDYIDWVRPQLEERGFEERSSPSELLREFRLILPGDGVAVRVEAAEAASGALWVDVSAEAWSR